MAYENGLNANNQSIGGFQDEKQIEDDFFDSLSKSDYFETPVGNDTQYSLPYIQDYPPQHLNDYSIDLFNSRPYLASQEASRSSPHLVSLTDTRRSFDNPAPFNPPERPSRRNRSLPRRKSQYFVQKVERQAIPVPLTSSHRSNRFDTGFASQSDPLQRWRNSPPESEPASISAIQRALVDDPAPSSPYIALDSPDQHLGHSGISPSGNFQGYRQTSSAASSDSGASESSQRTNKSARSRNRSKLKARRTAKAKDDKEQRRFKCTFCCDDFRTKYDWARHEKSLHLDLEEWRCAPEGSMTFSAVTGRIHCAYCNILDPTLEHLETHNYEACDNPEQPTKFHRKDHLVQHLRLVHHLNTMPLIDDWKVDKGPLSCRCGFCSTRLNTWDERVAHLSEHFRQGLTMLDWRGDHDFDPSTAAKVRSAIPPYCIGHESRALVPFMAADRGTQDHFNQISSSISGMKLRTNTDLPDLTEADLSISNTKAIDNQTQSSNPGVYTDMLARHLGRFAREQIMLGVVPTDEMFQREARRVVYDCESDGWNQTIADNEDWLTSFKGQLNDLN